MKKVQIILLIFAIISLCTSANPKYKLEIKNAEGTEEQIVLVPGIFTKITLVMTELQATNFLLDKYKYNITINDEKIIPYQKTMTLDPKENLIYSNYIGLKCSESSDIEELTLNVEIVGFDTSTSPETLEYKATTVKINKIKTTIKLDLLFKTMLQQSKNFFKLDDEIFNVEDIVIKLNGISEYFKHNNIKIPSFANRNILSKDAPDNHGILFDSPFSSDNIINSLNFDVDLELDLSGACFELLNSTFSFGIKSGDEQIQIDDNVKAAIIYNTQDITPKFDISSNIQLSMNIPKAPVILECKFSLDAEAFIGNDTSLASSEDDKIFKTIVTSTGKFDINMENLNVNGEYYAQCKISSTLIDDLITNITINIGDFLNSDIIKKLIPSKDPNATPQCATLTFENEQQANNFKFFGALFCSYYMKKDEPILSRVIPTIIPQVLEPFSTDSKPNQKILCVAPSALYHTAQSLSKKETDFNDKFDSFLKELQNQNTEYTMIKNIKVTKIEVEKDISINPESIAVSLKSIEKLAFVPHTFNFEIHNTHSQNLQCSYNVIFSSNEKSWLKYLNVSTTLAPNEKKEIKVHPDLTGFEKNRFYPLYIKCENLPNFFFKYETTGVMNKYSYYYIWDETSQIIDEITETTINCNEKKNLLNPRCLKDNFVSILDQLKTKIPTEIKDLEEAAKKFSSSSLDIKIKILLEIQVELEKIIQNAGKNIKKIIESSMKLLKYLTYLDCSIYASGSTDSREKTIEGEIYVKCKESKTSIIDKIINILKSVLTCDNIEKLINQQMLLSTEGESSFEDTIKYLFLFVNELTNNQEAISNSTIDFVIDLIECLEKNFDTIWQKLESILTNTYLQEAIKAIKKDLENIILQTLQNLAKIIHFEEIDGKISVNITNNGIIIDARMKLIYEKILDFSKKLLEFGSYNYTFSGSMLANIELKDDIKQISADVDTQQKIISVQGKDILIITNSNIMFKDDKIQALQTLVFDSPIVSAKTTANVEGNADALNLFVSITLYDKDGKEISLQSIDEKLRPQILYLKNKYQDLKQCFYYDDKKQNLITDGVNAVEKFVFQGQEYFKCVSSHLSEFTAGTAKKEGNKGNGDEGEGSNTGLVVGLVIAGIIVIALIIVGVICLKKKNASSFYGSSGEDKVKLVDM